MRRLPRFLLPIALMIVLSLGASAQDAPIYQRGYTVTENTMPPSPEPASAVKYADVPVTLSQGLVHYEIPFYTLQGRELSVPISLDRFSYNICGLQGSFVIQDDGEVYQLSGDGVLISNTVRS